MGVSARQSLAGRRFNHAALRFASLRTAAHRAATQRNGRPFGGGIPNLEIVMFGMPLGINQRRAPRRNATPRLAAQRNATCRHKGGTPK